MSGKDGKPSYLPAINQGKIIEKHVEATIQLNKLENALNGNKVMTKSDIRRNAVGASDTTANELKNEKRGLTPEQLTSFLIGVREYNTLGKDFKIDEMYPLNVAEHDPDLQRLRYELEVCTHILFRMYFLNQQALTEVIDALLDVYRALPARYIGDEMPDYIKEPLKRLIKKATDDYSNLEP